MRGSVVATKTKRGLRKGESAWRLIFQSGTRIATSGKNAGREVPKQTWVTFYGTKKNAEAKLRELIGQYDRGEYVEPSNMTVGQWLDEWIAICVKPHKRNSTYVVWKGLVENHLKPALGHIRLQQLTPITIQKYYADKLQTAKNDTGATYSTATVAAHHTLLSTALNAAVEQNYIRTNPAAKTKNKPRRKHVSEDSLKNCWTPEEAQAFMYAVRQSGNTQDTAFFALALETGMRRSELLGLQWRDVDADAVRVTRQLVRGGLGKPAFDTPKGKRARMIELSSEVLSLLAAHKREQATVKMANRTTYVDHDLVFAQAYEHQASKHSELGAPLNGHSVEKKLEKYRKAAGVRRITLHGLRHTCATMLIAAGESPKLVQSILGHSQVTMTLEVYSHVLPNQQAAAVSRLSKVLHRAG
jgi:integrase